MKPEEILKARANGHCELCGAESTLTAYEVPEAPVANTDATIVLCSKCLAQVAKKEDLDNAHLQCLTTSMWSEVPGVQVVAWRMLNRLRNESWAADSLDMLYLDDERLAWARATGDHESDGVSDIHRDSNGNILQSGDTVVLIKSLDLKGATVNARIGTVVRNIRLVADNTEQIEGKIDGQTIVILTKYLRKQGHTD